VTDNVHAFPSAEATERLIERSAADGEFMAVPGDLLAICLDVAADAWSLIPCAQVDSFGHATAVKLEDGRMLSVWHAADDPAVFVNSAVDFEAEAFRALAWTTYRGLAGVKAAPGPIRIPGPTRAPRLEPRT
jgi:hypothetical protein